MKTPPPARQALQAVRQGDLNALRKFLNADPDAVADPRLLNEAALIGNAGIVRLLLSCGSDPNLAVLSHEYYRPLHRAIEHRGHPRRPGHGEVVEALLQAGASLEARSTWMQLTPMGVAGMTGDREIIDRLWAEGTERTIYMAAVTADVSGVRRFLRRKSAATAKDENHMTPLHYAALCGLADADQERREIAGLLLDAGGDPDACEPIGPYPATPVLHFAVWKNYPLAEVLLSRGANPNLGFSNCLWRPPGPMAELFRRHGPDINGRYSTGELYLHSRIHWNLPSVALWLLKHGADPNLRTASGNTALHEAATRGINPKVVEALLAKGADPEAKNAEGLTALDIAKVRQRVKLIPLLERP